MGKIFCLLGQTSSGKTTLEKELLEALPDMKSLLSTTTRSMRDYESQYDPYYFTTYDEFTSMIAKNLLVEWTFYTLADNKRVYYGTHTNHIDPNSNYIKVINPWGYNQFIDQYGKENVVGIYIDCNDKKRLLRSLHREEEPDCSEVCRRFLCDKKDFKAIEKNVDLIVVNDKSIVEIKNEIIEFIKLRR